MLYKATTIVVDYDNKFADPAISFSNDQNTSQNNSRLLNTAIDKLVDLYGEKLLLETEQKKYSPQIKKYKEMEDEIQQAFAKLSATGFNDLNSFEKSVVELRAMKKTGQSFIESSPEAKARLNKNKTLSDIGSILSYM